MRGGLGEGEVPRRLAEIAVRGGIDAIGAGAEIDAVEIELEDLLLAEARLEPDREDDLLDLPLEGPLGREEEVLGKLLGQRRAALDDAAGAEIGDHGAGQPDRVDAEMVVEAAVLDRHHRLGQVGRHLVERQARAGRVAAIADQLAVGGDDAHVGRPLGQHPFRGRRQLRPVVGDERGDAAGGDDQEDDGPVDAPPDEFAERRKRSARAAGGALLRRHRFPRGFWGGLARRLDLRRAPALGRRRAVLFRDAEGKRAVAADRPDIDDRLDPLPLPALLRHRPGRPLTRTRCFGLAAQARGGDLRCG